MRYIPAGQRHQKEMLETIGVKRVEDLFSSIPEELLLKNPLAIAPGLTEYQLRQELGALVSENVSAVGRPFFAGAGAYHHFCPGLINHVITRAEFLTSYTPYQAEISQGTLTAIFEWQTMMASLTGLEVGNAGVYDGATAAAEAVLMARRITRRKKVLISEGLHPHYRSVIATYTKHQETELVTIPLGEDGRTNTETLEEMMDDSVACVLVQGPNFFGVVEDWGKCFQPAKAKGAVAVAVVNEALSLAFLEPPGKFGADICVGEAQSFGLPLSYGGPYAGFMTCLDKHKRQIPGRLVGQTTDQDGKTGYVLTLTAREQHIRRSKATSNICTNQGLMMLAATVYLELMGPQGLAQLAQVNHQKARYLERVCREAGCEPWFSGPYFNELTLRLPKPAEQVQGELHQRGIVTGPPLGHYSGDRENALLLCATEMVSREQIDQLGVALKEVC